MNWKNFRGGSWETPTIKRRQDGQWVPIGGGGGGGGGGNVDTDGYYTEGPPERDGDTITYDGTSYSSINDALLDLNSGDSLYIDPSNSPYVERIYVDPSDNIANGITIYSDWDIEYSDDGIATINQQGAVIEQPSDHSQAFRIDYPVRNPNSGNTDIELVGSYDGRLAGAETTEIEVTDSGPFSVGQQIFIQEETRPYGIPPSGGASGASETFEYHTIEAIDGNTLTLDQPLALPFPNDNQTAVGDAMWTMEDIHVHGLKFRSRGGSGDYCMFIGATYRGWFDNLYCENPDTHMIFHMLSMYNRFDNIYMNDGDHYGINTQAGTARTMCTNIMGRSHNRYVCRWGPSGQSSTRGYAYNVAGRDLLRTVGGVHSGGFFVDFEDLTVNETRAIVTRSWNITLDGFEIRSGHEQGPSLVCAQRPAHVVVKNGTIEGLEGSGNTVWGFRLRGSSAPRGPERVDNVTYENIDIEPYENRDKTELGYFETDDDSPTSGPLTFRDIYYGGEKLTQSDVEAWSGYDPDILPELTVE